MSVVLRRTIFSSIAFLLAFLILFGILVVRADWADPSQAAPGGNVAETLNVGPTTQTKAGKIAARQISLRDTAASFTFFHLQNAQHLEILPSPVTLVNNSYVPGWAGFGTPVPASEWNQWHEVEFNLATLGPPPPTNRFIDFIVLDLQCNSSVIYVFGGPLSYGPNWYPPGGENEHCSSVNSPDRNQIILKVFQGGSFGPGGYANYKFLYRMQPMSSAMVAKLNVVGYYYR